VCCSEYLLVAGSFGLKCGDNVGGCGGVRLLRGRARGDPAGSRSGGRGRARGSGWRGVGYAVRFIHNTRAPVTSPRCTVAAHDVRAAPDEGPLPRVSPSEANVPSVGIIRRVAADVSMDRLGIRRTAAASTAVSMPSAGTLAPISRSKARSAAAGAHAGSVSMPRTSAPSSLMMSGDSVRMCRREAKPAPASSTATLTPRSTNSRQRVPDLRGA
jgi:hypothetical protein